MARLLKCSKRFRNCIDSVNIQYKIDLLMRTFLLNLLLIQIFIKNQIIINDSTFLRKYTGSRKYVAASRKITIVNTIEHLLAHFDLHSNIGWFITRIVSTGCSTNMACKYVNSFFRLARE